MYIQNVRPTPGEAYDNKNAIIALRFSLTNTALKQMVFLW